MNSRVQSEVSSGCTWEMFCQCLLIGTSGFSGPTDLIIHGNRYLQWVWEWILRAYYIYLVERAQLCHLGYNPKQH